MAPCWLNMVEEITFLSPASPGRPVVSNSFDSALAEDESKPSFGMQRCMECPGGLRGFATKGGMCRSKEEVPEPHAVRSCSISFAQVLLCSRADWMLIGSFQHMVNIKQQNVGSLDQHISRMVHVMSHGPPPHHPSIRHAKQASFM